MSNSNRSNQIMVPNAREAMNKFKMEAANEVGVNLKEGYNGDLTSRQDCENIASAFPEVKSVMLGRALVADPGMLLGGTDVKTLEQFHDALLEEYLVLFGGSRNAMFRLKENWSYLLPRFENSEKLGKRLRKTTDLAEYRCITAEIFHTLRLK